jgi:hypothetical protein
MFKKISVQKALKQTLALNENPGYKSDKTSDGQSSIISRLIYDIFGGEILKTHKKEGWHFYNRIEGNRIDFTPLKKVKSLKGNRFEDLPSNPDEAHNYFEQDDYSIFFERFISSFEEVVGLKKYRLDPIV